MRYFSTLLLLILFASCGSSKKKATPNERTISVAAAYGARRNGTEIKEEDTPKTSYPIETPKGNATKADNIINTALTFSGVRYKYGGTTRKGMDCSGLLYVSFSEHDVELPRTSSRMAERGTRIRVKDIEKGDLLFFKTTRGSKRINHVGMVVTVENDEIKFIHASTSRGVTISSLRDGFWNQAFVKATRIL
ncbi:C40 family peptidase [Maribacter aurantiacus]|uniref:NlpC/P60 family protein n=1 Tax=Maribacter aurantiacus TaxID=1882343 RepID=A0A5R8MBK7_9FLAO|nr:C40 family peptidase [Maribacter aurantiacus]TLF46948.1 NlpC/P60 family protein [Maribacter aurantiacus]